MLNDHDKLAKIIEVDIKDIDLNKVKLEKLVFYHLFIHIL